VDYSVPQTTTTTHKSRKKYKKNFRF
jgi:hypothetical protein